MDFDQARQNMIDGQLRPNRVKNPALLARFADVPREYFVARSGQELAYAEDGAPLSDGRMTLTPLTTAHMIQELELQPEDNVLVVAAGV